MCIAQCICIYLGSIFLQSWLYLVEIIREILMCTGSSKLMYVSQELNICSNFMVAWREDVT